MSFNMKFSLFLILLIEIFMYIEAYRGYHPDAEMIDNNGPPTYHERMLLQAAAAKGMDPEAVLKVIRTRQPVFKKETLPNGGLKTSKYYLKPDGSIAVKVRVQSFKPAVPMDDFKPFIRPNLSNRHFFDIPSMFPQLQPQPQPNNGGREHVQTYVGPNGERGVIRIWSSGPKEVPYEPDSNSNPAPEFNTEPETKPWEPTPERKPEEEEEENFDLEDPEWKEAFGDDSLEESTPFTSIVTTPKTWSWPKVFPSRSTTTTTFKPQIDEDLTTTTTTTTTTTPASTTSKNVARATTTEKPLPSLDEFLVKEYGPKTDPIGKPKGTTTTPANKEYDEPTTATPTRPTKTPKVSTTTTATTKATTTSKTINIDDFDPNEVFDTNGQPIKPQGPHPLNEKPHVIRNIPKSTIDDLDPETVNDLKDMGINPDSFPDGMVLTKTVTGPDGQPITTTYKIQSPKSTTPRPPSNRVPKPQQTSTPRPALPLTTPPPEDFYPNPEENDSPPDKVSKPRPTPQPAPPLENPSPNENRKPILLPRPPELEPLPLAKPTRPSPPESQSPPISRPVSRPIPPSREPEDLSPYFRSNTNLKPIPPKPVELNPFPFPMEPIAVPIVNPIEAFLNKIGITKAMIWERNGRYVETFIDDEGCVLTATFVLSRPMPYYLEHYQPEPELEPIK